MGSVLKRTGFGILQNAVLNQDDSARTSGEPFAIRRGEPLGRYQMLSLRSLAFILCSAIRRSRALSCASLHCFPDRAKAKIIIGTNMLANMLATISKSRRSMCSLPLSVYNNPIGSTGHPRAVQPKNTINADLGRYPTMTCGTCLDWRALHGCKKSPVVRLTSIVGSPWPFVVESLGLFKKEGVHCADRTGRQRWRLFDGDRRPRGFSCWYQFPVHGLRATHLPREAA